MELLQNKYYVKLDLAPYHPECSVRLKSVIVISSVTRDPSFLLSQE